LRHATGLAVFPGTNQLFAVVQERTGLGENLVPDFFTQIRENGFYGWPYAYTTPGNLQPDLGNPHPEKVKETVTPDVLFLAHSGPSDVVFYTGSTFPEEYRNNAFVALHGSWNSQNPRGYMVVRVPMENGRPTDYYQPFATGFWLRGQTPPVVWGRPAGLTVGPDGALYISDDSGGTLWRIQYQSGKN
jgi:glucose/arabinose dehydrogenase